MTTKGFVRDFIFLKLHAVIWRWLYRTQSSRSPFVGCSQDHFSWQFMHFIAIRRRRETEIREPISDCANTVKRCVLLSDQLSESGCNGARFWSLVASAVSALWYKIKFRLKISDSNKVIHINWRPVVHRVLHSTTAIDRIHFRLGQSCSELRASQLKNKNNKNPFDCSMLVLLDWILIESATAKMDWRQFSGRVFRTESNQSQITESNIAKLCK